MKSVNQSTKYMQNLCKSKNGVSVVYDPVHSHTSTHLTDTPNLKDLVIEVIKELVLKGQEVAKHTDMKRVVGTCDLVVVDESDQVIYAIRKNRKDDGLVPFTTTRQATDCRFVAVHLVPLTDNTYELLSAWIGVFADDDEPFPQSKKATVKSKSYWSTHAFVWGSQEIIPRTKTNICPW